MASDRFISVRLSIQNQCWMKWTYVNFSVDPNHQESIDNKLMKSKLWGNNSLIEKHETWENLICDSERWRSSSRRIIARWEFSNFAIPDAMKFDSTITNENVQENFISHFFRRSSRLPRHTLLRHRNKKVSFKYNVCVFKRLYISSMSSSLLNLECLEFITKRYWHWRYKSTIWIKIIL